MYQFQPTCCLDRCFTGIFLLSALWGELKIVEDFSLQFISQHTVLYPFFIPAVFAFVYTFAVGVTEVFF